MIYSHISQFKLKIVHDFEIIKQLHESMNKNKEKIEKELQYLDRVENLSNKNGLIDKQCFDRAFTLFIDD